MNKVIPLRPNQDGSASVGKNKKTYERTPWCGNLKDDEMECPGAMLIAALIRRANEVGQQLNEMARELGVTYGYINQLRNGLRNVKKISDEFALGCARYLCLPLLTVLTLAGRVTNADFFESREAFEKSVDDAMAVLYADPLWSALATEELLHSSIDSKLVLVRLFERASGVVLIPHQLEIDALAQELAGIPAYQRQLLKGR